jgi:L-asparaginase
MTELPRVSVFTLGGTIASSGDAGAAALVRLSGDDLLRAIPQAASVATVDVRPFRLVPSGDLRLADLLELCAAIDDAAAAGADGIVVTQGTDTLEETAYAIDILTGLDVPIVVTGAMRNASLPGSDGPANLLAAIQVAASDVARGLGALVVFSDQIHAARHVRKTHATSTATFVSPLTGPIGYVVEDRVRILSRPRGRFRISLGAQAAEVRVAQAGVFFDDDGTLLRAVPGLGYAGLVVAAFGGGHVPAWLVPVLATVNEEIPVVLASRTGAGELLRGTYAYPGSEMDLLRAGLVPAVSRSTSHATVLLRLLLMAGVPRDALAWCFEQASDPAGTVVVSAETRAPAPASQGEDQRRAV